MNDPTPGGVMATGEDAGTVRAMESIPGWLQQGERSVSLDPPAPELEETAAELIRSFAFVDLCGFVAFLDEVGPVKGRTVIRNFRELIRACSAQRGVRVAKWIGDGALLVGLTAAPVAAAAVEIVTRAENPDLRARAGLSVGRVLNVDGDDYIGRAINLSSRLCDMARPGEVLADSDSCHGLPEWICRRTVPTLEIKGIGGREDLSALTICTDTTVLPWEL